MTDLLPALPVRVAPTTLLICDDRPVAREVLTGLLRADSSFAVTAALDGSALVDAFTANPADVVLIGVRRGSAAGPAALALLLGVYPAAAVIVFGGRNDAPLLTAAVAGGAMGLAIWDINHRRRPLPLPTGRAVPGSDTAGRPGEHRARITDREVQVLQGMSCGRSNIEIGNELSLSEDTVKTHARRLFDKIGARDRAHAVGIGLHTGLLR